MLRLFAVAWAVAVIFDFGSVHRWDRTVYDSLLMFAAFATICRGGTVYPFVLMCALQVVNVVARSPFVSNHWLFMGIVSGGLLLAYLLLALRNRSGAVDAAELFELFAPAGRWCLLILYFYVVFHKLNPDFLDPSASSGALFWRAHAEIFPLLPADEFGLLIGAWSTIIIESLIPLLLVFRTTRVAGVMLGLGFHWMVAVSPLGRFWDFSSPIFAMFVLFLPERTWAFWVEQWPRLRAWGPIRWWRAAPFVLRLALGTLTALALLAFLVSSVGGAFNKKPFLTFWIVYGTVFAGFVVPPLLSMRRDAERRILVLRKRMLLLAPALVVFNGLNPYLGLKTESSFAMFSNLRTENGGTNHYLVPASLQVFPFQKECVEIVETTNARLQEVLDEGRLLTLFEFRVLAAQAPGGSVRYRLNGEEHAMRRFENDPELLPRPHPFLQWYLRFRPIYADGRAGNWH